MTINGLQKLTLLDFPGKVACTVFTAGCNMRCPFCHNASLVRGEAPPVMETEEFYAFLKKRTGILEGVAITGGEPLIQPGIGDFAKRVNELGFAVKLDTNGTQPEKLRAMIDEGLLDYVAMDIKNSREKYKETAGISGDALISRVSDSIEILLSCGIEYEFRTTVTRELHTPDDIADAAKWISGAERYYLQQFRDSGELLVGGFTSPTKEEMEKMADAARPFVKTVALRGV